jgi:3-phenylpropionate/trans-cinnamate dioxygenase ferredoxin reductase subunit
MSARPLLYLYVRFCCFAGIDLKLGVTVVSVKTDAHAITLADGSFLPYDKLLCATGGAPRTMAEGAASVF